MAMRKAMARFKRENEREGRTSINREASRCANLSLGVQQREAVIPLFFRNSLICISSISTDFHQSFPFRLAFLLEIKRVQYSLTVACGVTV